MTPKPARRKRFSRACRLALAACALAGAARAAPTPLDGEADVAAFASRVRDYGEASFVRWTIVAPTQAEAAAKIEAILADLPPSARGLAARLIPQAAANAHGVSAFVSPQIGAPGGAGRCSWQVWVSDPELPAGDGQTAMIPLASHDRLPVSAKATFRVGHFGLVQARLYAFDETHPGAIRDLATVPEVDIPVAESGSEDYIVLAAARNPAPFLDGVKSALAASQGARRDLGPDFALRRRLLGASRGIGANIEAIPSGMIAAKESTPVALADARAPQGAEDSFMETCLYALTPAR